MTLKIYKKKKCFQMYLFTILLHKIISCLHICSIMFLLYLIYLVKQR